MTPLGFPVIHNTHTLHKEFSNVALKNVFSALLLSHDKGSLAVARKVLEQYGIDPTMVSSPAELDDLIRGRRYDLAVIDSDFPGAATVGCLDVASRWNGISVVLRGRNGVQVRGRRIHLLVPKPFSSEILSRGIKAAYTTMAKKRLATYRHPVTLKLLFGRLLQDGLQRPVERATVVNLSHTGLCLSTPELLPAGALVIGNLPLPESDQSVNIAGTVIWSDTTGKTGLKFQRLSNFEQKKLHHHLDPRLPWRVDFLFSQD